MKWVSRVETFDGKLHHTEGAARHHVDVLYTNCMSDLAARLCQYADGKHAKTMDWLDENLSLLGAAAKMKSDMMLEKEED